jgi:bifunctional UDP-N-acetylglucosamine pyrophosphorylase/glucosamine-1-phosphate N-acetyltransferase
MGKARAAIILAAGKGVRMRSDTPKVLHEVGGRTMLDWAVARAAALGCERTIVVAGAHAPEVGAHAARLVGADNVALQDEPLGTGHAVRCAQAAMAGFEGDVAVMFADTPLTQSETLENVFAHLSDKGGVAVLGFEAADPSGYGRLILAGDGSVERIVEDKDASAEERAVRLCNSGVLGADAAMLFQLLSMLRNDNAKGEYYLTDIVGLARSAGFATHMARGAEADFLGVNSRMDLAAAEAAFQARARRAAMEAGVTLIDPSSVYFSYDTEIEPDVIIEPNVYFGPGVKIGRGARIRAFCHFTGAEIGPGAEVGPSARLRPGAKLGAKVKIGNFVEVKNSTFGDGAKASHLTYVGDSDVGARANLGAGTVTCNYDGEGKYRTRIGEDAFIGSDTSIVAPVQIGARAYTGSGSVITLDVPDGALAVARGTQKNIEGWADKFRARAKAKKDAAKKSEGES